MIKTDEAATPRSLRVGKVAAAAARHCSRVRRHGSTGPQARSQQREEHSDPGSWHLEGNVAWNSVIGSFLMGGYSDWVVFVILYGGGGGGGRPKDNPFQKD